jgi:hypothetical protein
VAPDGRGRPRSDGLAAADDHPGLQNDASPPRRPHAAKHVAPASATGNLAKTISDPEGASKPTLERIYSGLILINDGSANSPLILRIKIE